MLSNISRPLSPARQLRPPFHGGSKQGGANIRQTSVASWTGAVVWTLGDVAMSIGPLGHLYDSARWKRMRTYQLQLHPLCKYCAELGRVTPATIVDHIEPHKGDVNKFWLGKLQSLCDSCHKSTKAFLELNGYRLDIGLDGWPLDPRHPVYRSGR